MRYRFGAIELDAAGYSLRRDGREVSMRPKMFELLCYLIEHRQRVVTKEELLSALWAGEQVSDASIAWTVSHVRSALGQERGEKQPIETIHGRGYRFRGVLEDARGLPRPEASRVSTPPAAAPPLSARPFVGRGEVMRRLESSLLDTAELHGRSCVLYGEAGIGKTRCVEELRRIALRAGLNAWSGRAVEDGFAPVFWPWIQVLRDVLQTRPELRDAGERLLSRLSAPERASSADGEGSELADRFWLLDEVTQLLAQAVQTTPALLVLDDLQWADAGTLDLLRFVTSGLSSARVLVVATARVPPSGELDRRIAEAARRAERIELTRLSPEHVADYIAELTALPSATAALAHAVHRVTAGNPLFMQETVRMLLAEHGRDALATLAASEVQPRSVLQARLAPLAPAERSLLACASVLGEEFDLSLLQAVSGVPLSEMLELLESADARGLIVAETPQRCTFAHGLIKELLYKELKARERVALHRRAAEALDALRDPEPRHGEIARHYYLSLPAGRYDRVAATARRAAAAAEAVFAFEDAVRFYEWALAAQALDDAAPVRQRAELLLGAGSAQRLAGRVEDARKTMGRLFELARQHRFPDLIVRGARALRPTPAMASLPDTLVREALEHVLSNAAEPPDDASIRARAQLACVPPYSTDMARSKQLSAEALAHARGLGSRSLLFEVLCARMYALSGPDDTEALLATAAEVLDTDGGRATPASIEALCARAAALIQRGEIAAADQAFEQVGSMSSELRLQEGLWYRRRQTAQRLFLDGHFDAAEAECKELRAQGDRLGLYYRQWFTESLRRAIALERGEHQAVATGYDFAALIRPGGDVHLNVRAQTTRIASELGRMEDARRGVELLAAIGFETFPKDIAYLHNLSSLALAVVALADRPRAEQLHALLAPYPHHNTPEPTLLYEGSVSRYLALLADCLDWHDRAETHFEDALAMNQRLGQRPLLARTRYEHARWLARRGDHARAGEQSRAAAQLAESLGMTWLAERARALAGAR